MSDAVVFLPSDGGGGEEQQSGGKNQPRRTVKLSGQVYAVMRGAGGGDRRAPTEHGA